jgi:hypothetical protein
LSGPSGLKNKGRGKRKWNKLGQFGNKSKNNNAFDIGLYFVLK